MRDIIKRKLEQIDRLYPIERVAKSKERWTNLWLNKPMERLPYVYYCATYHPYDDLQDKETRLIKCLDDIIIRGQVNDDYVPNLFCGCRQSTIPNMFGFKEIYVGKDATVQRILDYDYNCLPNPAIYESSVAKMWLEMQEYFLEETDGILPIKVVDMQGPFDAASQLLGYDNLFLLALDDEVTFSKVINKFIDAFCMFWKAQEKLCGSNFIGTHLWAWDYVPPNMGATMSIDSLVMVSPDFFENYYKQTIAKVSDVFGGVTIHSCGNFSHLVPNLAAIKGLKAINSSQMSLKQLIDAGMPKDMLSIIAINCMQLPELMDTVSELGIRVNMTLMDFWWSTVFKDGKLIELKDWTPEMKQNVVDKDKMIREQLYKK